MGAAAAGCGGALGGDEAAATAPRVAALRAAADAAPGLLPPPKAFGSSSKSSRLTLACVREWMDRLTSVLTASLGGFSKILPGNCAQRKLLSRPNMVNRPA